jgi:flagellar hook-associated protein 1 FlgK
MPGIFDALEVAKRALLAQQAVLQTVGHNLANGSTPGYTRQRVELSSVGTQNGVEVSAIRRLRDRYLDFSVMAESQTLGQYQAQQAALGRLQATVTNPPGSGLSDALDQFFQGFEALAADPTDQAVRVTLRDTGARLATTIRGLSARIDQLQADFTIQIQQQVGAANGLIGQIAEINRQVQAGSNGRPAPNDLLDKRDQLVDQLNAIIGVTATDRADGTVQLAVTGSGVLLVDGTRTAPLTTAFDPGADRVDLSAGGVAVTPAGGGLAAVLSLRNSPTEAVKQAAAALGSLTRAIITEVNRLHASGTGLVEHAQLTSLNGVSSSSAPLATAVGLPFSPSTGSFEMIVHSADGSVVSRTAVSVTAGVTTLDDIAAAIDANPELSAGVSGGALTITASSGRTFTFARDTSGALAALGLNVFFSGTGPSDIALAPAIAADAGTIAAAQADAKGLVHPGDGAQAQALAGLRSELVMGGGTATFSDFIGTTIGAVGSRAREADDAVDRQTAALGVVQSLQQQTSGVSIDEEMIALTQSQYAYAAAGRYMRTTQDMIQSLLDMMSV